MFCYNKRHLHALGLMIASTCERNILVEAGGRVGDTVFRQSRDPNKSLAAELQPPGYRAPKPISLARSGGGQNGATRTEPAAAAVAGSKLS